MAFLISGETFTQSYRFTAQTAVARFAGPSQHSVAGVQEAGEWKFTIQTEGWPAGLYWLEIFAEDALGTKFAVIRERLEVKPSLAQLPEDSTTPTERMVQMIEACLAGNASQGVQSYKINNRELSRYSISELLKLLGYYKNRLSMERRTARNQSPLGPSIRFRF
jgi:hypothetical protein